MSVALEGLVQEAHLQAAQPHAMPALSNSIASKAVLQTLQALSFIQVCQRQKKVTYLADSLF